MQTPPQFSAIKVDGERAYDIARDGGEVVLAPRMVISKPSIWSNTPRIGQFPGLLRERHLYSFPRPRYGAGHGDGWIYRGIAPRDVGPLGPHNAISLDSLLNLDHSAALETALLPVETVLDGIPALNLNQQEAVRLKNGQMLSFISRPDAERLQKAGVMMGNGPEVALAVYNGTPVALVEIEGVDVHPVRVLNL